MAGALLAQALTGFMPSATTMTIDAFNKAGFDFDKIGRKTANCMDG